MSNLKQISESVIVQLNAIENDNINSLSRITKPLSILPESVVRIDELTTIDLQIDEIVVLKQLLDNVDNDLNAAIKIYQEFKRIDNLTLLDSKMWTYYSLDAFWEYTYERFLKSEFTIENFKKRALLNDSTAHSLISNSISRLWWIAHMTRNPRNEDNYEITKYVFKNEIFIDTLLTLPQFSNIMFVQKFFEAYILITDRDWLYKKEDSEYVTALYNYIKSISVYKVIELYEVSDIIHLCEEAYELNFSL